MRLSFATLVLLIATTANAEVYPSEIIDAVLKNPWGRNYPALPNPSEAVRGHAGAEIAKDATVREAMLSLAPSRNNGEWFRGIEALQAKRAVWCLQVALCHPHADVQIKALRAIRALGAKEAVSFVLLYAEYEAIFVAGSESATIHGIVHSECAATLSALTGITVKLSGQDPEGLMRGVRLWRGWLVKNEKND